MTVLSEPFSQHLTMCWHQELALRATRFWDTLSTSEQDMRRHTVLMAACRHQDIFYLVIHQLCCLWSIDKAAVHDIFDSLTALHNVDSTFDTIRQILNNDDLSPCGLRWYASFPQPIREALTGSGGKTFSTHLVSFMGHFATLWHPLLDQAGLEDQPISGSVLKHDLDCSSPILRYILFVASSLQIGIVAGPDATILDEKFEKDETDKYSIRGESVREVLALEHTRLFHYHHM
ncbi:hypothetical protein IWW34DRAFT_239146 [Fusarium oxysporum f. sp. albedinis]|nr:hypothetical protein IWW34DRAFT_239146 [Fusarium oxysporum f. sp. albedinis]KAK2469956.1 hypothetical protein H9L39_18420 [Fusarium oxysporum f. sp. albedinis]